MTDARKNRIPELDGLRVLMVTMVGWYHIWQQSWLFPDLRGVPLLRKCLGALGINASLAWLPATGYIWVDGTILLSVFLLYLPFAEAKRKGLPAPRTGDFYFRRARRILPSYYFILICHLLLVALPWKLYGGDPVWAARDFLTHLTFTFMQHEETYLYTQLGGAAWTVAVLALGYLLFPLMARGLRKRPAAVLLGMAAVCFAYRGYVLWAAAEQRARYGIDPSYGMAVNQFVNFLDVYVIGVLCATGFDAARAAQEKRHRSRRRQRLLREAGMTLLFLAAVYGLARMLQLQSRHQGAELQAWQMTYRPVFALCFGGMIVSAPFALKPLRLLLGNPVTRFLAGVSMNFYLVHQTVAVHLKYRLQIPWSDHFLSEDFLADGMYPNQVMNESWMVNYAWLSAAVAFVMAVAVTYLVEKPGARLFDRVKKKLARRRAETPDN